MSVAVRFQRFATQPSIRVNHAACDHRLSHKAERAFGQSVWNPIEANPSDPLSVHFGCDCDQGLTMQARRVTIP
jgi:hypothetical protein